MNKAIAVMLAMLCIVPAAFAQDGKPQIAVYMTGGNAPAEVKVLSTRMLSELSKRGLFRTVERGDAFQDIMEKEIKKQTDGSVDRGNQMICEAGKQFKVDYVCAGDITSAFGMTQISTRILDVETMEVIAVGDVEIDKPNVRYFKGTDITQYLNATIDQMTPGILKMLERKR